MKIGLVLFFQICMLWTNFALFVGGPDCDYLLEVWAGGPNFVVFLKIGFETRWIFYLCNCSCVLRIDEYNIKNNYALAASAGDGRNCNPQ